LIRATPSCDRIHRATDLPVSRLTSSAGCDRIPNLGSGDRSRPPEPGHAYLPCRERRQATAFGREKHNVWPTSAHQVVNGPTDGGTVPQRDDTDIPDSGFFKEGFHHHLPLATAERVSSLVTALGAPDRDNERAAPPKSSDHCEMTPVGWIEPPPVHAYRTTGSQSNTASGRLLFPMPGPDLCICCSAPNPAAQVSACRPRAFCCAGCC